MTLHPAFNMRNLPPDLRPASHAIPPAQPLAVAAWSEGGYPTEKTASGMRILQRAADAQLVKCGQALAKRIAAAKFATPARALQPVMPMNDPLGQGTYEAFGEVLDALALVRKHHPECTQVEFFRAQGPGVLLHTYRDADFHPVLFSPSMVAEGVQDVLRAAKAAVERSQVELPVTFVYPAADTVLPAFKVGKKYRTTTGHIAHIQSWGPRSMRVHIPGALPPAGGFVQAIMTHEPASDHRAQAVVERVEWHALSGKLWNGSAYFGNLILWEV